MKARAAIVASSALFGLTALAAPAAAQPPGAGLETIPATCDGQPVTVTTGGGASFWLNGQHYLLTSFEGSVAGEVVFEKVYGNRTGLGPEINCEATIVEPEGTLGIVATAVAVP